MEFSPDHKQVITDDTQPELQLSDMHEAQSQAAESDQKTLRDLWLEDPVAVNDALAIFIALTDEILNGAATAPSRGNLMPENVVVSKLDNETQVSVVLCTASGVDRDCGSCQAQEGDSVRDVIRKFGAWLYQTVTGQEFPDGGDAIVELGEQEFSEDLSNFVSRCVNADISKRYQSIAEVRSALIAMQNKLGKPPKKTRAGLDKWTKVRLVLWLFLGFVGILLLLPTPDPPNYPDSYFFPKGVGEIHYFHCDDLYHDFGEWPKIEKAMNERREKDLRQYPPEALLNDIVDRHTGKVIFHSDQPLNRGMLLYKAIQAGRSLRGAELHHIYVDTVAGKISGGVWNSGHQEDDELSEYEKQDKLNFSFRGVDLRDALISDCEFRSVDLTGCDLRGATIRRTGFEVSIHPPKLVPSFDYSRFDGCNLDTVALMGHLNNAVFDGARLAHVALFYGLNVSFKDCRMKFVTFDRGTLEHCDFTRAKICHGNFESTDLRHSTLRDTVLFRCDLSGADVADVDHDGTIVVGCRRHFRDSALKDWSSASCGWVELNSGPYYPCGGPGSGITADELQLLSEGHSVPNLVRMKGYSALGSE
jgi:uncharacterized protein YjbI with pentapeptide repeats